MAQISIRNETSYRDLRSDSTSIFDVSSASSNNHQQNVDQADVILPSYDAISSLDGLDCTPSIMDLDTPDMSLSTELDQSLNIDFNVSDHEPAEDNANPMTADSILKEIRVKNVNRVIIGTININYLAPKFDQLKEVIGKNIDILTIQETKLDSSFPTQQFLLDGYSQPYRLDRNREGGGVLIYVREDIPSKLLDKHNLTKNVEGLFIEINLRKTKCLFFG